MRAGLSTIQQTLTPEAASVLNRSMGEAARRSHGQTTPLHVAATLLAAPSGLLRQACIRSHPTSSHPLQCRALELCFSVALDRLPTTTTTSSSSGNNNPSTAVSEPPISNALMAALKRAQAHQRRGCPEQQQQPLLAVKVELEQLVISILDDPSVSRVMREASFSSPDVKATIEQSLSASPSPSPAANPTPLAAAAVGLGLGLAHRAPTARNLYMNPRLHQHQGTGGAGDPTGKDELKRVVDIMMRPEKRNPVLVADADPVAVMREVLRRIETGDAPPPLRSAHVIPLEKEWNSHRAELPAKIKELGSSIEARIGACSGVILDLGDLKWLVDSPGGVSVSSTSGQIQQQIVSETARAAVAEMGKLLGKFGSRVWLFGAATCATYLRCQVYHPTMEKDWDLQAVPIAPRSPLPNFFPRHGGNGILSSSVESLAPIKGFPAPGATTAPLRCPSEGTDSSRKATMCPACMDNYERELAKLVAKEPEKPPSSDSKPDTRQALPHWLQLAKPGNTESRADQLQSKEQEFRRKHKADELLKRWRDTCSRLHPTPRPVLIGPERPPAMAFSLSTGYNSPAFPPRKPFEPKVPLPRSINQLNNQSLQSSETRCATPPRSMVKTDLVLGHLKASDATLEKAHSERVKDLTGCAKDGFSDKQSDKIAGISDYDSFKRLFKGLAEKVGWQPEAASAVATVVMQCKSGNGKTRGVGTKGDTWLLFAGPDKVGKRKMASTLSELVFGIGPITIHLGGGSPRTQCQSGQSGMNFRGKTSIDMVADAVRRNPFSVVVLEGIDRADALAKGSIKRAIERGRLLDSQGREVGLGSVIFVLTTDWLPDELKSSHDSGLQFEDRITELVNCGWQLELSVGDKPGKRDAEREGADGRPAKLRKESSGGGALSLDLNLAVGVEDDAGEGSWNSSDLTVEHEQESLRLTINCTAPSSACELMGSVDEAIVFKPVDFGPLRRKILESISTKFDAMVGGAQLIRVDEDVLDRLVGGLWLAEAVATGGFEEWAERVLVPSLQKLKRSMKAGDEVLVLRLSAAKGGQRQWTSGDWLPETVAIAGNQTGWAAEA